MRSNIEDFFHIEGYKKKPDQNQEIDDTRSLLNEEKDVKLEDDGVQEMKQNGKLQKRKKMEDLNPPVHTNIICTHTTTTHPPSLS